MPFTPAHVAAVLPFRGRAGLPFAALAMGSMSPDLPYYLTGSPLMLTPSTHSVLGLLSWDLLFGLAMWAVWRAASGPLHDLAPESVRSRWQLPASMFDQWRLAPIAVLIGSITHVLWDEFTHAGRFGATNVAFLAASYPGPFGPMEGSQYLQYASGILGLAAVLWVGLRSPKRPTVARRQPLLATAMPLVVLAAAAAAVGFRLAAFGVVPPLRALAFSAATALVAGACVAVGGLCIVHAMAERARLATK